MLDPEELFTVTTVSRREIAELMSDLTVDLVPPNSPALTADLCREYAAGVSVLDIDDPEGEDDERHEALLSSLAMKAGFEIRPLDD